MILFASVTAETVTISHELEILASVLFALAVMHTFMVGRFRSWAHHYPEGSVMENLLHLLGEVEAVFLLWAAALFTALASLGSWV